MNPAIYRPMLAVACVLMVSTGQLMFRQTGLLIERRGGWMDSEVLVLLGAALAIYGLATLLWINLLRSMPLAVAYPFMGLSFLFVPLLGALLLRESITLYQGLGAALILAGISVTQLQP
jgi:drug/metabolite transporter (DMT)-like permease